MIRVQDCTIRDMTMPEMREALNAAIKSRDFVICGCYLVMRDGVLRIEGHDHPYQEMPVLDVTVEEALAIGYKP